MSRQTTDQQRRKKGLRAILQPRKDSSAVAEAKPVLSLETGVVVLVDAGPPVTVTLTIGPSAASMIGVHINPALTPTALMPVWVLRNGNDLLVFCERS